MTGLRRVVVTGIGCVTPVGNTKKDFWKSLCEGKSGIEKLTAIDTTGYTSQIAGQIKDFKPAPEIPLKELKRMDKFVQYAANASFEAIADAGVDLAKFDRNRIGTIIGCGVGGIGVIEKQHDIFLSKGPRKISPFVIPMLIANMASGHVSILLGIKGPNSCVVTACASGGHSIGSAYRMIQLSEADMMLAGGTESPLSPLGVGGFCALKALSLRNHEPDKASRPFDLERDGFVIAEGAGIVVLEELEHALRRKAEIYAELVGYGMSADAFHITAPDETGNGAVRCIEAAIADSQVSKDEVTYINAHGTSTKLNDKIETIAIKNVFKDRAKNIHISSTKSMTGHLLGAAGGIEFAACALSIKEGIIPPTINYEYPDPECDLDYVPNTAREVPVKIALSNSLGFGGHNVTLVLRSFE
ncbi:MAG: beta-ketoacyl-ACP synthase II [Candidatus Omnitrophota bacterium]